MSQISGSKEDKVFNETIDNKTGASRPPRHWIRLVGIGCLSLIACSIIAGATIFYSGILSGPHGNGNNQAVWSPDGKRIAFSSDRGGNSDIYVMNVDGSHVQQLTRDPFANLYFQRSALDQMPTWSPDGTHIAFVSGRDNEMMNYVNHDIYSMDMNGSNIRQLTGDGDDEGGPSWSPDGKLIAYDRKQYISAQGFIENPNWDIYRMNADGSQQVQLTNESANELEPAWSPDGAKVVFLSDINGKNFDLYIMNVDGSDIKQLTKDSANETEPAWSPDGKQIIFESDRNGNLQLFIMNIDGSNLIQLTSDRSNSANATWSPDGKHIIFESDRDTGNANIYVINADGSNIIQLTGK